MFEWDKLKYFEIYHFHLDYNLNEVTTGSLDNGKGGSRKETK